MATKQEKLQALFHRYQIEHGGVPETPYKVVKWALDSGLLDPPKLDPATVLADSMSRALREEYSTDPATGRRYRRNHAVTITTHGVQGALWAEIERAPRDHMLKAFQQRRAQIVGDCVQLKTDVDVYNGRNPTSEKIQLELDFTNDVAEVEAVDDAA